MKGNANDKETLPEIPEQEESLKPNLAPKTSYRPLAGPVLQ